jgi:hypothetical protein
VNTPLVNPAVVNSPLVNPHLVNTGDADRWPALLDSLGTPDPEEARLPIS